MTWQSAAQRKSMRIPWGDNGLDKTTARCMHTGHMPRCECALGRSRALDRAKCDERSDVANRKTLRRMCLVLDDKGAAIETNLCALQRDKCGGECWHTRSTASARIRTNLRRRCSAEAIGSSASASNSRRARRRACADNGIRIALWEVNSSQ